MTIALIVGVNGQDGQYLKETLLKDYSFNIYGLSRQDEEVLACGNDRFEYLKHDLQDSSGFMKILNKLKPDIVFYCAAIHGSLGYDYEDNWELLHQINTISMHAVLKYLCRSPMSQAVYFSSVKVFDENCNKFTEETSRSDNCLYSFSKNTTERLINYYRQSNAVRVNIFWLNNHESALRGKSYFSSLIVDNLHLSLENNQHRFEVETLDFFSDWGHDKEYMEIIVKVALSRDFNDYIISTGESVYARDLVEKLYIWKGLDYKKHIEEHSLVNKKKKNICISSEQLRRNHGISPKLMGLDLFKTIFKEKCFKKRS